jgi:hypothetical protein
MEIIKIDYIKNQNRGEISDAVLELVKFLEENHGYKLSNPQNGSTSSFILKKLKSDKSFLIIKNSKLKQGVF